LAKGAARYVCQSCGASHPRWSGRCDACGEWNTIVEEAVAESAPKGLSAGRGRKIDLQPLEGESAPADRRQSGIAYRMTSDGSSRMIADMTAFFTGEREELFAFTGVHALEPTL